MNPETFCHYYNQNQCRSCKWIELPYAEQLLQKERTLKEALSFAASIALKPTIQSPIQGFRNKAKLSVTGSREEPILGITGVDKIDEGRALLSCPIHHPKLNQVIEALPQFIREYNLIPYQIEARTGELKGVILFYSEATDEMYLRFVLRSKECVSRLIKMLPVIQTRFPFLKIVSANLQPVPHAILEGREEIFISDLHTIHHQIGNLKLQLAPQAFVQTNVEIATHLYQTAADWIKAVKPKVMADLFCGQGPFSFFAAESAEKIVGIEVNADAVKTANETAKELGLTHLSFKCVDVAKAQSTFEQTGADLALVNPPRRGLGQEGITMLVNQPPDYLIYSSCSYESLARDLQALSSVYTLQKAQIFDLFPHTAHFETLVQLKKI
jgi:23S rRNA (uracil747-C5)-methyltransferase